MAPPYDARAIANLLLDLAAEINFPLTQMSILKLIYFAHGWYLARWNRPLIFQEFEAWQYGPVIKVVRDEFKRFGDGEITDRAQKLDLHLGKRSVVNTDLLEEDVKFVAAIFSAYHVYDAWQLSELTHERDSPWDRVWNASEPVGRMALRLRNEDIRNHFASLSKSASRFRERYTGDTALCLLP